jgi:fucose 4-O-acetylase-like acetyltransferase
VVLGHAIQNNQVDFDANPVFRFIYSFHMPLFMFVSGFVSFKTFDGSKTKLLKRFRALIIPFWVWFALAYLFYSLFSLTGNHFAIYNFDNGFLCGLTEVLKSPDNNGLWFLWVLFLNYLVLFVSIKLSKRFEEVFIVACLLVLYTVNYIGGFGYLGVGLLCWYLPFYLMGYVCNKYMGLIQKQLHLAGCISMVLFPILAYYWSRVGITPLADMAPFLQGGFSFLHRVAAGVTGILSSYVLFGWLVSHLPRRMAALDKLGGMTLEVYCLHYYLLYIIVLLGEVVLPLKIVLTFIFALSGSIFLKNILNKNALVSLLLFNKKM